jgi:hypothetical protein
VPFDEEDLVRVAGHDALDDLADSLQLRDLLLAHECLVEAEPDRVHLDGRHEIADAGIAAEV